MEKHANLVKIIDRSTTVTFKALSVDEIKEFIDACDDELNFTALNRIIKQSELMATEPLFSMKISLTATLKAYGDLSFEIQRMNNLKILINVEEINQELDFSIPVVSKKSGSYLYFNNLLEKDLGDIQYEYESGFYQVNDLKDFADSEPNVNILKIISPAFKVERESEKQSIVLYAIFNNLHTLTDSTIIKIFKELVDTDAELDFIYKTMMESNREISKEFIRELMKFPIKNKNTDEQFYNYLREQHFSQSVISSLDFEIILENGNPISLFNSLNEGEIAVVIVENKWDIFKEDLNYANSLEYCIKILNEKNISDKIVMDFLNLNEDLPAEINKYLMSRSDFIIIDPMVLLKVSQKSYLSQETINELSRRYEAHGSKLGQVKKAIEFQKYFHEIEQLPKGAALGELISTFKSLRILAGNIDDSIVNENTLVKHNLPDCEFDSDAMALVSARKLDKLLSLCLQDDATQEDFINFAYNELDEEQLMFQKNTILSHPNCPMSLLHHYSLDGWMQLVIVRNHKTSADILEHIVKNTLTFKEQVLEEIKKHPNCSQYLRERLIDGDLSLMEKVKTSTDESFLDDLALKMYLYPKKWDYPFDISDSMRCKALDYIASNKDSGLDSFNIYCEAFHSAIYEQEDPVVKKIVLRNKHCTTDITKKMLESSKEDPEFVESWLLSDSFNEEEAFELLESHFLKTLELAGSPSLINRTWRTIAPSNITILVRSLQRSVFEKFANNKSKQIEKEFLEHVLTIDNRAYGQELFKLFSSESVSFYGDLITLNSSQCNNILAAMLDSTQTLQA